MNDTASYLWSIVRAIQICIVPPDPPFIAYQNWLSGVRRAEQGFNFIRGLSPHQLTDLIE
jgi:hypothetical protein